MKRRLLFTSSYHTEDDVTVSRAYFFTDSHVAKQPNWSRRKALPTDITVLIELAISHYLKENEDGPDWCITSIQVSDNRSTDDNPLVYLLVKILPRRDCVTTEEVDIIVTLGGDVLIPEIREFSDLDDYYAYCDEIYEKPAM